MSVVDGVRDRRPVVGHDGRSGARIERGVLPDGTAVYVKTSRVADDLAGAVTGSVRRELDLFASGVLHDLPPGTGTALLAVEEHDGTIVTLSRDVGASILGWDDVLDLRTLRRLFARVSQVHAHLSDVVVEGLCPLSTRLGLFAPDNVARISRANPELGAAVSTGWERFADLVPTAVSEAVFANLAAPDALATRLLAAGSTVLHGDLWLVNLAFDGHDLVLLDWGLATCGPPAVDLVAFCLGAMSNVACDRDALLEEARRSCGAFADDDVFAAACFWGLMELGWNKALDATSHPDDHKRAVETADLDFWVGRAGQALERGLVPV